MATSTERVRMIRNKYSADGLKSVEFRLSKDHLAVLDAMAANSGVSRALFLKVTVEKLVLHSGYFLSNGKLYHHDRSL